MSFLTIDDQDERPPYEQLSSQLARLVVRGELEPGDRLAPIRQLAGDLGVAPNTVARAYRELEQLGVIVSRGRRGTVVAERGAEIVTRRSEQRAVDRLQQAVADAVAAGMSSTDIVSCVERRLGGSSATG